MLKPTPLSRTQNVAAPASRFASTSIRAAVAFEVNFHALPSRVSTSTAGFIVRPEVPVRTPRPSGARLARTTRLFAPSHVGLQISAQVMTHLIERRALVLQPADQQRAFQRRNNKLPQRLGIDA